MLFCDVLRRAIPPPVHSIYYLMCNVIYAIHAYLGIEYMVIRSLRRLKEVYFVLLTGDYIEWL